MNAYQLILSGGKPRRPPLMTTNNEEDGSPMPPGTTVRKTNVVSTGGRDLLEVRRGILYGLPIHLYGEQEWVNDITYNLVAYLPINDQSSLFTYHK